MNYQEICETVIDLVKETGEMVLELKKELKDEDIVSKGKNDFVTMVDKASERKLVEALGKLIPESGFIAEEGTSTKKGDVYNWVIDPIDGTTNFMHGAPPFSISIALQEKDDIVIGVVYEMFSKECFYSWKGGKAYLNGSEIQCSNKKTVEDSLIATGFPYKAFDKLDNFMKTLLYFMDHSHGVRRLGSAAVDLAYVACGRYDAFYEYGLQPWDVAAGAFLIEQAGGSNSDFSGAQNFLLGKEIISGNAYNFKDFQTVIDNIMHSK